jgi:hypothetical protein
MRPSQPGDILSERTSSFALPGTGALHASRRSADLSSVRWSAPMASSPSRAAAVLREQVHKPFHGFRAVPLGGGKPPRVLPRCALPSWGGRPCTVVRDETRRYTRIPSTALLEYAFVAVATYYSRSTILDSETSEDDSVRMWPRRVTHVSHVEM